MQRLYVILPLIAGVLLVSTIVLALWMIGSASGERARFSSLEIAPKDTDVFVAVNTDPTSPQWLAVEDSLSDINAKDPLQEAIDEFLAGGDLDWREDILPIAGDEAFVSVPDVAAVSSSGGVVAALSVGDEGKAQELVDRVREQAGEDGEELLEEEYEGVTIYYYEAPPEVEDVDGGADEPSDPLEDTILVCVDLGVERPDITETEVPPECLPFWRCPDWFWGPGPEDDFTDADGDGIYDVCLKTGFFGFPEDETYEIGETELGDQSNGFGAIALFDGVLAFGLVPEDVKLVVDVVQGRAESAVTNERLQEFRALQKQEFLVWAYADAESILAEVEDSVDESLEESTFGYDPAELFAQLSDLYDRFGFSISSHDQGFAYDMTVITQDTDLPAEDGDPAPYEATLANRLPQDTMIFFGADALWSQTYDPLQDFYGEGEQQGQFNEDLFNSLEADLGIDLEEEVLQQLIGEVAIAANITDFDATTPDVAVAGLAEVDDPDAALSTIDKIVDFLEREGLLRLLPGDGPLRAAEVESGESIGWTVDDGTLIFGYPEDAVAEISDGDGQSLSDSEDWQTTMDRLPDDPVAIGFVSLARVLEEIGQTEGASDGFSDSTSGDLTLEDLEPIRSVGFAATVRDNVFGYHAVLIVKD